jgi:hypothetical protein
MEDNAGQCRTRKQLAVIQNDEQGWMDPAAQPVSTVTKITAVCAVVTIMTTKLANSAFSGVGS